MKIDTNSLYFIRPRHKRVQRRISMQSQRGTPHMKGMGMLVVSLSGVNFGFWSHVGCSGENAIIFSRERLVYGCTRKNIKMYIYCLCFNMVSFRGQKSFSHTQIGLL